MMLVQNESDMQEREPLPFVVKENGEGKTFKISQKKAVHRFSYLQKTVHKLRLLCDPSLEDIDHPSFIEHDQISCPGKHPMSMCAVPHMQFTCDLCESDLTQGEEVLSCRRCNFDACMRCIQRELKQTVDGRHITEILHVTIKRPLEVLGLVLRKAIIKTAAMDINDSASLEIRENFKAGDRILTLNGNSFTSTQALAKAITAVPRGEVLTFKVARVYSEAFQKEKKDMGTFSIDILTIKIIKAHKTLGLTLEDSDMKTVRVDEIKEVSCSEVKSSFQVGDRILSMNNCVHSSMKGILRAANSVKIGSNLSFVVLRTALSKNTANDQVDAKAAGIAEAHMFEGSLPCDENTSESVSVILKKEPSSEGDSEVKEDSMETKIEETDNGELSNKNSEKVEITTECSLSSKEHSEKKVDNEAGDFGKGEVINNLELNNTHSGKIEVVQSSSSLSEECCELKDSDSSVFVALVAFCVFNYVATKHSEEIEMEESSEPAEVEIEGGHVSSQEETVTEELVCEETTFEMDCD
mmetsp:Transcript_24591/g.30669  ORF Transcript_24591/g.30669 Transcript_24591/m.30669 type:complete len:525 (-) Transcript_24591:152-1726(-)